MSINETITAAISSSLAAKGMSENYFAGHADTIEAVTDAVQEREYTLAETIVEKAEESYGYGKQARQLLEEAGLTFRPIPEPVEEEEEVEEDVAPLSTDEKVDALAQTVADLAKSVGVLTDLAQKHLGASL